jgi:RNA polymerase primary sigma factor
MRRARDTQTMSRAAGKTRPTRKHRMGDLAKTRGSRTRGAMSRVVKARGAGLPEPANDTDLALDGALPEILEAEGTPVTGGGQLAPGPAEMELAGEMDLATTDEATPLTADRPEEDEAESDEDAEEEDTAEVAEGRSANAKRSGDDEPASFLAMYFRDMAELEVLRPEQEFDTARTIEEMELDLWKTILSFAPGAGWMADTVEKAVGNPVAEMKGYRFVADRARKKSSIPSRAKFEKEIGSLAAKLRTIDIDRIFLDAAVAEINRVGRATRGLPFEGQVPFTTGTKAFRQYVKTVGQKAFLLKQAKNEFVKANLRLVVSIARRFNHGRLPLADLIQEGNIGLMKAVERYDYRRGFRFSTYASWWIRHAISRALADKGRAVRLPVHMIDAYHRIAKSQRELQSKLERPPTTEEIAAATGIEPDKLEKMKTFLAETPVSLDRPISDEDGRRLIDVLVDPNEGPTVPEQMASSETQAEMLKLLGHLKPIEADILRKRFGLLNDRERTLKEIGDEYSLSRERVRQLQEQALGKMRRAMAKREML